MRDDTSVASVSSCAIGLVSGLGALSRHARGNVPTRGHPAARIHIQAHKPQPPVEEPEPQPDERAPVEEPDRPDPRSPPERPRR